ncbi:MAG TPA: hypothetical protein VES95_07685 [Dermatophilaceae bacterium]|nr:hypothetical protein [Dermatophilaceae bacterium]
MANLTITVDDETLRRARIRALERGESVNAYLAHALQRFAQRDEAAGALERIFELADGNATGSGVGGRSWTRDELHRG